MWTFRHTALLTRVHSTPSSNTSELCSRLTSEMRHPTTASNGNRPFATGPADKSPRPTANSMGRGLVISHPSSRGYCCCKVNVFRFGVLQLSKSGRKCQWNRLYSVPRTPCNNNSTALGTWSNNIEINKNKIQISGKRARCSLSKLVTGGIFHVQKIVTCWWEMHPPRPPPGSATAKFHQIFSTCYLSPWLGPPLTAIWYVMYFRFCGWWLCFHTVEGIDPNQRRRVCFIQFAGWRHWGEVCRLRQTTTPDASDR